MSILTDFYRFERTASKAKTRMDCVASTRSYEPFEEKRTTRATKKTEKMDGNQARALIAYYCDQPSRFKADPMRKTDKSITIKGKNMSSVFVPDPAKPFAHGDVNGTSDAILIVFHKMEVINGEIQPGAVMEIYVARGKAHESNALYFLLEDGELEEEMSQLRATAKPEPPSPEEESQEGIK